MFLSWREARKLGVMAMAMGDVIDRITFSTGRENDYPDIKCCLRDGE